MDELRRIRHLRGMSQEDLAKVSGVSDFTISELEGGKRPNPRPSTLRKLADALGVDVAALFGEEIPSPKVTAPRPESEAAALFRDLAHRGDHIASRGRREGPSKELTAELAEYHDQVARLWRRIGGRDIYGRQSEELDDAITAYHVAEDHIQQMIEQDLFAGEEERTEARRFRKTSPQDNSAEKRTTDTEIA